MISLSLRIFMIVITIIYILLIVRVIRKEKLQISYVTFWVVSALFLLLVAIFPEIVVWMSNLLGFEVPSNMIFVVTIFILYFINFKLLVEISKEKEKSVTLAQELSILKKRVKMIEDSMKASTEEKKSN